MQKTILLFGAGKSATALIRYLVDEAATNNWKIIVADTDKDSILLKANNSPLVEVVGMNVEQNEKRLLLIQQADIVISLMPPSLHFLIAKDCVECGKNLLTASYIDEQIKTLKPEIESKGLLFVCEMGLDPGIDHMSAMELIDSIHEKGGIVHSFKSHCGGLIAPESATNFWRYKVTWNPKNIVTAGKAGAIYKTDGLIVQEKYEELFDTSRSVDIPGLGLIAFYPNRNSLNYIDLYNLQESATFMRTTLRPFEFMNVWKSIVDLKLTDETKEYQTDGLILGDFFKQHLIKNNFEEWMRKTFFERFAGTRELMEGLNKLTQLEKETKQSGDEMPEHFMTVNGDGTLEDIDVKGMKMRATKMLAMHMYKGGDSVMQLFSLGMDDTETVINKGLCSAADVLQFALEKNFSLEPDDKDMVVMLHEISYTIADTLHNIQSHLIIKGENALNTAMAKTVGLPLGIAAKLILNNTIQLKGLHIPVKKEIYEPVLKELKNYGISFIETITDK